ncbi:MAG TPA: hemolysin family protein [Syntrophomonadaceae bacterium]|nr:hemolysin family protein [Syntrophomonadaceae bacterium]
MQMDMGTNSLLSLFKVMAALALVGLNGLFVTAEFAFVKARPTRISQLAAEGDHRAVLAGQCLENIDDYLSVSQLGITLASLGLGWLGEPAVASLLTPWLSNWGIKPPALVHSISFIIAFSIITFLHVVLGELTPKTLAIQKAEVLSLALAPPMRFFFYLFYPGVVVLNGTAGKVAALLGLQPANEADLTHSEEELRMLIAESFQGGQINESEQELLQNVFRFEKRIAEEIMVPRPEVVFLFIQDGLDENINIARQARHTRFPLCDSTPDQVIGLIHIKDLLYLEDHNAGITSVKRDILFVPEGMALDRLLQEFQRLHQHMAVVIDEYGGTAGIVTMDNILEELVGDIQDEFDEEEPEIVRLKDGSTLVSGRMLIDEAVEYFGLVLGDEDEQYSTLAGYVLGKLAKKPSEGDAVSAGNVKLEVIRMQGMRIDRIKVHPCEKNDE